MSLAQQANHLKLLYQKKFYRESPLREEPKNFIPFKYKLPQFNDQDKNKSKQPILGEGRKRGHTIDFNPSVRLNKVYDFQYSSQREEKHLISFRNFAMRREQLRPRSVIGNNSVFIKKQDNWIEDIIAGSQKTKQKYFLSILKQRKIKAMNTSSICTDLSFKMLKHNNIGEKQKKKKERSSRRLTISQVKKKCSRLERKEEVEEKKKEQDENYLLPWDTEMNEF